MSIYLDRAIRQRTIEPEYPLPELPRVGKGFLYHLKDGDTTKMFYSPMTKRPFLRLPPALSNAGASTLDGRNYDIQHFLEPQWYMDSQAFFGFIPLNPCLGTLPVNPLHRIPRVFYDQLRPVPEKQVWDQWREYQNDIHTACHLLLWATGKGGVAPLTPCARVDQNPARRSKGQLQDQILQASRWFEVWYGILSHAIAVYEAVEQAGGRKKGDRDVPGWLEILLAPRKEYEEKVAEMRRRNKMREVWQHEAIERTGHPDPTYAPEDFNTIPRDRVVGEAFVSSLLNSCIGCFDGRVERVGVFVHLPESAADAQWSVSIDWLCAFNIPVFYPWGKREEDLVVKYPWWKRYQPPPGAEHISSPYDLPPAIHGASDTFPPYTPDICEIAPPSVSPGNALQKRPYRVREDPPPEERTWEAAFQEMEVGAEQELALLTPSEQRKRRAWQINPPRDRRKVVYFIWEWLKGEKRCAKRKAMEDDFDNIDINRYGQAQRRFFPARGQWHLCEYMGPPDLGYLRHLAEFDVHDSEADYDCKFDEALKAWRIYFHLEEAPISNPTNHPEPTSAPADQVTPEENVEEGELDEMEELGVVVVWMNEALGFTLPPGLNQEAIAQAPVATKGIAKYIYLLRTSIRIEDRYWNTEEGQAAAKFIAGRFKDNGAVPDDLCDLSYRCPVPIRALPRFRTIHRERHGVRVQNARWDNVQGYSLELTVEVKSCYWLEMESYADWYAGSTSAASILLMTRLPVPSIPYEIALGMALRGACFQTWHRVHSLDEAGITPSQAPHLLLYRSSDGFPFTKQDFEQYQVHLRNILDSDSVERGAIRRGGITWRIAMDAGVEPRSTLRTQPSIRARLGQCAVRYVRGGDFFIDDALNTDEEAAITGTYFSLRKEQQLQRLSWWPDPELWDMHFGTLGWSEAAEAMYRKHKERILQEYKPWSREQWRKELHIKGKRAFKFWNAVEDAADEACRTEGGMW